MPLVSRFSHSPARRRWLQGSAAALAAWGLPAAGQARTEGGAPVTVAQVVDMSPNLQDVGRDFLVGAQAAWQSVFGHEG